MAGLPKINSPFLPCDLHMEAVDSKARCVWHLRWKCIPWLRRVWDVTYTFSYTPPGDDNEP